MPDSLPAGGSARRTVYCLCAEWCGVCREWRAQFQALASALPSERLVWVDVDAHEDVLDILDIETFPVLLIARDGVPLFCGAVQPSATQVQRLLQGLDSPAPGLAAAAGPLLTSLRRM